VFALVAAATPPADPPVPGQLLAEVLVLARTDLLEADDVEVEFPNKVD
jgi:hypothetical protein